MEGGDAGRASDVDVLPLSQPESEAGVSLVQGSLPPRAHSEIMDGSAVGESTVNQPFSSRRSQSLGGSVVPPSGFSLAHPSPRPFTRATPRLPPTTPGGGSGAPFTTAAEEGEEGMPDEAATYYTDAAVDFDVAMRSVKPLRGQTDWADRKGQNEAVVDELLRRMDDAHSEDLKTMSEGRPALRKLELLPTVVGLGRRANVQKILIEKGFLPRLAKWMAAPRGELPVFKIRQEVVRLLLEMPYEHDPGRMRLSREAQMWGGIEAEDLEKAPLLGRMVRRMTEHPSEVQDNQRLAANLVEKWSRAIFALRKNYKELGQEEARRGRQLGWQADKFLHVVDQELQTRDGKRMHLNETKSGEPMPKRCRMPTRLMADLVVRPDFNPVEPLARGQHYKQMEKALKDHRQRNQKDMASSSQGGRMVNMSIEGSSSTLRAEPK
eukprot:Hpha_TRINITY_DN33492_c0_g1::TRINITY_DN33492_c0_g1_i1::g.767::m.767/K17498/SPN1, IWS1; transcription factor SPN1